MKTPLWVLSLVAAVSFGCSGVDKGLGAYERGDYPAAVIELRPLAERGYTLAQYTLGLMYTQGYGVPQDYIQAFKWFQLAAAQGVPEAQYELGMLYARGQGVPQDYVLAHAWLNLAAASADVDDARVYASDRDAVAAQMSREQVAEAQRLARESLRRR